MLACWPALETALTNVSALSHGSGQVGHGRSGFPAPVLEQVPTVLRRIVAFQYGAKFSGPERERRSARLNPHNGLAREDKLIRIAQIGLFPELDVVKLSLNLSNPGQNGRARAGTLKLRKDLLPLGTGVPIKPMEINVRRFRKRWWRRISSIPDWFAQLRANVGAEARKLGPQRMCPFCGLITSRHKTCCLECGRSLKTA
jgi:hypothetical protein